MKYAIYFLSLFYFLPSFTLFDLLSIDDLSQAIWKRHYPPKFIVITSLYNEQNIARVNEYIYCLEKNLSHPLIEKIHVLYDTSKDNHHNHILEYLKAKKIPITYINGRPSYEYCFNLANKMYRNRKIILTNADIYFNHTLNVLKEYRLVGKFLAITRHNVSKEGALIPYIQPNGRHNESSQDTWIFNTPIRKIEANDIELGTKHCDGRIAYQAKKAGLKLKNPCLAVQCCHVHLINIHHYHGTPYPSGLAIKVPWSGL